MKFISKELAVKLKEKGFNRPCFGYYYIQIPIKAINKELILNDSHRAGQTYQQLLKNHVGDEYAFANIALAPTNEQVLKWLREEKNIHIGIIPYFTTSTKNNIMWGWEILLVGKIIECTNILYIDKDYNYTKMASENCCADYNDACINAIEFVINNLI